MLGRIWQQSGENKTQRAEQFGACLLLPLHLLPVLLHTLQPPLTRPPAHHLSQPAKGGQKVHVGDLFTDAVFCVCVLFSNCDGCLFFR